jgi:hypothetical protein
MGERGGAYRVLAGKPEERRPLGRPRHRWEVILKWFLKRWNGGGMDWIDLTQDKDRWWALANVVINLWASIKCREFLE